jgi:hypothetical protein
MKYLLYILIFFTSICFSQSNYKLVKTIDVQSDFFTTDNQSNMYVVKGNELTKYDKAGKLLYKYSNKNLGNISSVDVSNMLRILVFYKDFLQIVLLDNTLSLNGEPVSLDKISYQQAQLVCSSHNSGVWIYDQQNIELVRLDQNFVKTQQTGNLSALLNENIQPDFLLEYDNKVYLNNPSTGILIFDIYGTYFKTIPVKNVEKFQPTADVVYFISDKKIKSYNIKTSEEKEFTMPIAEFKNFGLQMNTLLLQTNKAIYVYIAE